MTLKREGQLQRFLRKLKKDGFLNEDDYKRVYPSGSQTARIYGLPKLHKSYGSNSSPPFRPIVSSIGTFNYNLSKYLCTLLTPFVSTDFSPQDSFTFVHDITEVSTINKFLVSYDVTSLFTNIPLEETINLAVDIILENKPAINISKQNLKKLFLFATSQTHFLFNNDFYDQIDGVALGSPLAPTLANLFMGHHEKNWIKDFSGQNTLFYRRYVDDIFALFNNENEANTFLSYLNSRHNSIKFTVEKETDRKLSFLDVLMDNSNNKPITSIYRKKTFTGLLMNFQSFTCFSYKLGLIKTLIDRTFKINNTWEMFHLDLNQIKKILKKNFYPEHLIDKTIKRYLNEKFSSISQEKSSSDTTI